MTDQTAGNDTEAELEGEESGASAKKRMSGKKLVLFILAPVVLLLGMGGAILMTPLGDALFGKKDENPAEVAEKREAQEAKARAQAVFFDLPELLVNLNTGAARSSFLKVTISLELSSQADVPQLEQVMPRIVDNFQVYLRELRVEDLRGSAGMYRLREDLLRRVNEAARPVQVNDVLFKEVLVQ